MRVYLSEMGDTRCGACLIGRADPKANLRDVLRGWEMLSAEQAHCLESDLAVALLEDKAFEAWGLDGYEIDLIVLAASVYCDSCGERLDGRSKRQEGRDRQPSEG